MLREIKNVRQIPGEGTRRWFRDAEFDLIVWYDDDGGLTGFQLCYDKEHYERAITWYAGGSYVHARVDDGESPGEINATPILVSDGVFDASAVAARFRDAAAGVYGDLAELVYTRLREDPA
jgi:hypothetical protein